MVGFRTPGLLLVSGFLLFQRSKADHACSAEQATACPDESGAQLGRCLQDPEQHQSPTTISSECSDYIALNQACESDIEKFCDESYFSEDTLLCLTEWTQREDLSAKCRDVLKWVAPQSEVEDEAAGEEEDGMSETERQEKKEWHEKRKANRGDAVELRRKEEEKAAEQKYAQEHPEEYAEQQRMIEEEKKQKAEIKRRERLAQAAIARKKLIDAGLDPDGDNSAETPKSKKGGKSKGKSWVTPLLTIGTMCAVGFGIYYAFANGMIDMGGKKGGRGGGGKKRRG